MPRDGQTFDLGLFYGDQGGPGTSIPHTDSSKRCPFLDKQLGEFCSLDGNLCPFVGFNYRKCKKYTNNIARGALTASGGVSPQRLASNQPPRLESLTEAKKGGSRKTVADAQGEDAEFEARHNKIKKDIARLKKKGIGITQVTKVVTKEEAAKIPNKAQERGAEAIHAIFNDLMGIPGLTDPNSPDGFTPTGREELSLRIDDLIQNHVLRKPGAHQDQYPKRVRGKIAKQIKAKGMTARTELKIKQAKDVIDLGAAYDKEILGIAPDEGTRAHRKLMSKAMLQLYGEKVSRTEREPGPWNDNVHDLSGSRGGFNYDAIKTTDDEMAVQTFGTPYGQGRTQTPSDVSNQTPVTGPHMADGPSSSAPSGEKVKPPKKETTPPADKTTPSKEEPPVRGKFKIRNRLIKGKTFGGSKRSRHPSKLPQSTREARRPEHLASWLDSLTEKQLEMLFDGDKSYNPYTTKQEAIEKAEALYKVNNTEDIAKMDRWLKEKLKTAEEAIIKAQAFDRDLEAEIKKTEKLWPQDRDTFEKMRKSDRALNHTAKVYNNLLSNVFEYKIKKVNIGDQTVVRFLRGVSLPVLNKGDFEVIRMNEQLAMAAIREQHQYGRKYGKFNTVLSLFRDIIAPAVIMFFPLDSDSKTVALQFAQRIFSAPFWKEMYFSMIENPLPKYQGSDTVIPARDANFLASKKMSNLQTRKKIMGKYHTDPAGVPVPPDWAVLHSRAYPTTKTTWGKQRKSLFTQLGKQTGEKEDWRIGFSRAARR